MIIQKYLQNAAKPGHKYLFKESIKFQDAIAKIFERRQLVGACQCDS